MASLTRLCVALTDRRFSAEWCVVPQVWPHLAFVPVGRQTVPVPPRVPPGW